jgi:hypothetical protein
MNWNIYAIENNILEQDNFQWDDDVLDQYAELDFYRTSSLKQQSVGRHVAPLGLIILILSQPVCDLDKKCIH